VKAQLDALVMQMYKGGIQYDEAVREFQKVFIVTALRNQNGNQIKAARELGMHRNSLRRLLTDLDVDVRALRHGLRRPPRGERLVAAERKVSH
jgi:Fis family transcriptional regulator